ncbi:DNA-binding response regulator [Fusibacter sp. 3D3]|nr:DNA-binding response regulator [Fusibacter sp. 3D3]
MITRKASYLIFSYGLFLSWLLSFLYNGSLLSFVFKNINITVLAMVYIIVPAIACYCFAVLPWKKHTAVLMMKYGLSVSMIGTTALLYLSETHLPILVIYILSGVLGLFSVIFIAGWGVLFIQVIEFSNMFVVMAATICLSRICISFNGTLSILSHGELGLFFVFFCLIFAYIYTLKIGLVKINSDESINTSIDLKLVLLLCLTVFFTNVGGGLSQTLLVELTVKTFRYIYIIEGLLYGLFILLIFFGNRYLDNPFFTTLSIIIIGMGFLMLIVFNNIPTLSYLITTSGYLFLDIILWTLVAKISYLFNEPFKVFFPVMGSNLLAVFLGNVLAMIFRDNWQSIYIAVALCTMCIFLALPLYNALHQQLLSLLKQFRKNQWLNEDYFNVLTEREREIVLLMLDGLKNKDIAEKIFISENTLKTHAKNIYAKTNVSNKKELIEKYENNLKVE